MDIIVICDDPVLLSSLNDVHFIVASVFTVLIRFCIVVEYFPRSVSNGIAIVH